jgi:mRNA interferase MazF
VGEACRLQSREVWLVDSGTGRGGGQGGARPALVIQNDIGNVHGATTIVAAITSTIKPYPVTVLLADGEAGLKLPSMVNLAQILTVDKMRLRKRVGALREEKLQAVDAAVRVSLGV